MHDPLVVAFDIKRPWPRRSKVTRKLHFPAMATIWHREPGGRDALTVCKRRWKFHIHHWRIQIHPLQELRRKLFTRCTWCGGKHTKGNPVNVSSSWDRPRTRWWSGEPGLFHSPCSGIPSAKNQCLCEEPCIPSGSYGDCAHCGKRRYGEIEPMHLAIRRLYATVPDGQQPSEQVLAEIDALVDGAKGRET